MKQKKIILILWKRFDQIIQAIVVTVICYKQSYGWMRMNGSHGSLCIPSRSLKLLKRAVSKVFQFQKLFSLLLRAGAGKTKTKLEYLKMVCMQNSLRITLG